MKRTSVGHMDCSVARSLDVVGEWWTLLVVRELMQGHDRFEVIQTDLGIARNILSDRLNTLVAHGVAERVKYHDHPERFEYHLTEKGRDLFPVIVALMGWGDRWAAGRRAACRGAPRVPRARRAGARLLGMRPAAGVARRADHRPPRRARLSGAWRVAGAAAAAAGAAAGAAAAGAGAVAARSGWATAE